MKLTKLQRYTAYCIMLKEAESKYSFLRSTGFCYCVGKLFGVDGYDGGYLKIFPELIDKRTTPTQSYHFMDKDERVHAIKQCIEETHPDK